VSDPPSSPKGAPANHLEDTLKLQVLSIKGTLSDMPMEELGEIEAVISGAQCWVDHSDGLIQKGYESEPPLYRLKSASKPIRKSTRLRKLRLGKRKMGQPRCINRLKNFIMEPAGAPVGGFSK